MNLKPSRIAAGAKVLITGATGLIGKEVGKLLAERGYKLVVLSRDLKRAKQELPFPAEVFNWDGQGPVPTAATSGVEGAIHLAGESVASGRWSEERKKKIRDSRVLGTRSLVEAFKNSSTLKVYVQGSALGIYGDREDEVVDETSNAGEGFLADVVRDWEAEARALESVARVSYVRTGLVFARHGGALEKMMPIFRAGLGGRLGSGKQWMSWIHLDDIARLFVYALETETVHGILNGTAPEPVRNERFTVEFARSLKRPVFLPVPSAALKTLFGEMSSALLTGQRVVPKRVQEFGFKFQHPELIPALREISTPLAGASRELLSEQWVPYRPDELFTFFSDAENLEKITPPFLNFRILRKSTDQVESGTLIDYRLSLHGIPIRWRTKIEDWEPPKRFTDTQLSGPYSRWHHTHEFVPLAGGTLMRDRVQYRLPLGWLGSSTAGWKVENDVAKIFSFRRKAINDLYGERH